MFKYKIKIILKSGYEIRVRAKDIDYNIDINDNFYDIAFKKPNNHVIFIIPRGIAAIIVKHWYQRWE